MQKEQDKFGPVKIILFLAIGLAIGYFVWGQKKEPMIYMEPDMNHAMEMMNHNLHGKNGDEFDKSFLEQMIVHHQGAVDMANTVLKTSQRPELIQLANEIITAQNKEIKMMQDWQTAWFK